MSRWTRHGGLTSHGVTPHAAQHRHISQHYTSHRYTTLHRRRLIPQQYTPHGTAFVTVLGITHLVWNSSHLTPQCNISQGTTFVIVHRITHLTRYTLLHIPHCIQHTPQHQRGSTAWHTGPVTFRTIPHLCVHTKHRL